MRSTGSLSYDEVGSVPASTSDRVGHPLRL
jgi:hypothetical protein